MAGSWGSKRNGVRIGVFYDGIALSADGSQARITDARVAIDRDQNISDSSNHLSWSGGAVPDGDDSNINVSGSGEERIKTIGNGTWVTLSYGATTSRTFSADFSGVDYAGGTLSASRSITYPARTVAPPADVTGVTASRVSDTQQTISWTNHDTVSAPYTNIYVERWDSASLTWVPRVTLAGTATNFVDASTVADRRYQYRVRSGNAAGYSAYATSNYVATTPAAPSNATAVKSGSNVQISWINHASYATGYEVWDSENGAAATLKATVSGATSTWTHVGASNLVTHTYSVRAVSDGPLYSAYTATPVVTLAAPPNAPTLTASASVLDFATTALILTIGHNPVDSSSQTAAELRYRVGAGAWTTIALTTQTSYTFNPGTLFNANAYEFQARTKGVDPSFGPWSASVVVAGSTTPLTSITSPANGASLGTGVLTVVWTYFDAESTAQSGWRFRITDDDNNVIYDVTGNAAGLTHTFPSLLDNNETYTIDVWVRDGSGLWSLPATSTISTDFFLPPKAALEGDFVDATGSTELVISNPPKTEFELDALRQTLQRYTGDRWVDVLTDIPVAPPVLLQTWNNLATNPSFETVSGTVEVRRNMCPVPRAANAWGSSAGTGGTITVTTETDARWRGGTARRAVWTVAGTGSGYISVSGSSVMAVGETWIISIRVATVGYSGAYGLFVGGTNSPTVTYGTLNQWSNGDGTLTLWRTATCTSLGAGSGAFLIYTTITNPQVGQELWAGDAMYEKSVSTFLGYFDGTNRPSLRRNAAVIPYPVDATGYSSNNGALYPVTYEAAGGRRAGTGAKRADRTGTSPNSDIASWNSLGITAWSVAGRTAVAPGEVWTISCYVKAGLASAATLGIAFYDAANAAVGSTLTGSVVDLVAGEWARVSHTVTVPASATNMGVLNLRVYKPTGTTAGGEQAWVTDVLIERVSAVDAYFDGAETPAAGYLKVWMGTANQTASLLLDADLTPAWAGTTNNSESVLTGSAVVNSGSAGDKAFSSSRWALRGTKSLRLTPVLSTSSTDYVLVAGSTSSLTGLGVTFVAGQTYTVVATCHLDAAQTGSIDSQARTIRVSANSGAGNVEIAASAAAPNSAGSTELRVTFVVPALATSCYVVLWGGNSIANGDVFWDGLSVVPGTYPDAAFDGSVVDADPATTFSWSGTAHASTSTKLVHGPSSITVSDHIPQLNDLVPYRVLTWSGSDTTNISDLLTVDTYEDCWSYLNGGPGWETLARFKGVPSISVKKVRAKVLHTFVGRTQPIEFIGDETETSYSVRGLAVDSFYAKCGLAQMGNVQEWENIAYLPAPLVFRDPRGRRVFASIGDLGTDTVAGAPAAEVSLSLTEVEYVE